MCITHLLFLLLLTHAFDTLTVFDTVLLNGTILEGFESASPVFDRYTNNRFVEFYAVVMFPGTTRDDQVPVVVTIDGFDYYVDKFVTFASNALDGGNIHLDDDIIEKGISGEFDGVIALDFVTANPAGYSNYLFQVRDHSVVEVPVVMMELFKGIEVLEYMNAANGTVPVVVRITSTDENQWKTVFNSLWFTFWRVTIVPFCAVNMMLASHKLMQKVKSDKVRCNLGQILLISLTFANFYRVVMFFFDPLFSNQVLPYNLAVFMTLHFPFEQMIILLFAFYWNKLLRPYKKVKIDTFLGYLSIPFGIIAFLLFAQEFVGGLLRGFSGSSFAVSLITISALFYAVFDISIAIYFFKNGFTVLKLTKGNNTPGYMKLRNVTIKSMFAGFMLLLWVFPLLFASFVPTYFFTPIGNTVNWYFLMLFLLLTSYIEISAISVEEKIGGSSTNDKKVVKLQKKELSDSDE